MRDIGRIDKRVSQLETYTALSLLEKSADSLLIEDVNGNNRFKNGIIVDPFNSLKLGDVAHPDYYAAIDTNESCLRPIAIPTNLSLNLVTTGGATTFVPISNAECGVIIEEGTGQLKPLNTVLAEGDEPAGLLPLPVASGLYMMPYTQEPFVVQPMATRAMTLTPFEVVNLEGKVQLIPKEDDWVDVERMPDLNIDFAGNNDVWNDIVNAINDAKAGPFALKYGEWQTYSTQLTNETRTTWRERLGAHKARNNTRITRTYENNQTRTVHQDQLTTSTEEVSLGDRVVDVNIIPYMRGRRIRVIVTGLKTNSRIYPFFDGQDVSQYCYLYPTPQEFVEQYRQTVLDEDYKFTNTANGFKKTTNTGLALIIFDMPDGIFRTGDRKFSVSDHPNNDITRATTFASGVYSANGLSQVRQSTNGTIRDFDKIYDVQLPNEEQIVITTQDIIINGTPFHIDPLAQTFTINKALYPNGIYLTSVDIFFARKPDNSTNIPVEVQIRPTVNAFPDAYKIHPGARAILHPSQVKVSDNPQTSDLENTATRFNFDTPVYLEPGEHALVVKSTTAEYEIYIGEIGQNLLNTTTRVVEQPYMGVFFASSNATTWLPKPEMDMMMILNKAVFPVNSAKKLTCESSPNSTVLKYETLNFSSSYQEFDQCKVGWEVSEDGGNQWTVITPNENIDYNETKSIAAQTGKLMFRATATTTDPNVSPIINVDRLSAFVVKNIIENGFTDPDELLPFATHYADNINEFKRTRYITRIVTLEEGFEATGFKMLLAVNKPAGTKIKVFLKYQPMEETRDFHINPWVELVPDMGVTEFDNYSTPNSGVYIDVPFAYLNSDGLNDTLSQYNKFAIKICLYAPNAAIVPKVTDLRGIAVL
jgi:hypothetical protein